MAPLDAYMASMIATVAALRMELSKEPRPFEELFELLRDLDHDIGLMTEALEKEVG